jgi:hypothetical protein
VTKPLLQSNLEAGNFTKLIEINHRDGETIEHVHSTKRRGSSAAPALRLLFFAVVLRWRR